MLFGWRKRALQAEAINEGLQEQARLYAEHLAIYREREAERLAAIDRQNALIRANTRLQWLSAAHFDLLVREHGGDVDAAARTFGHSPLIYAAAQLWEQVKSNGYQGAEADAYLALAAVIAPRDAVGDAVDAILSD